MSSRLISNKWKELITGHCTTTRMKLPDEFKLGSYVKFPINIKQKQSTPMYSAYIKNTNYKPIAFQSNFINEKIAVGARVMKLTPVPDHKLETEFCDFVKKYFDILFPEWKRIREDSWGEYLRNSNASPAVKKILDKTFNEKILHLSKSNKISHNLAYKWTTRKAFCKVENLLYKSPKGVKRKAPRLIQGAQPEFICVLGPFFSALQNHIKRIWGGQGSVLFASGKTNLFVSQYISKLKGLFLEDDVSAFDSSVSKRLNYLELWMCKKFGLHPLGLQLFEANIMTHGFTQSGIKYSVPGTRKSGDPWTTVFNSILNALIHIFAISKANKWSCLKTLENCGMVVSGDDSVVVHGGVKIGKEVLLKLGFECEVNYKNSIYDLEFCSNIFYDTTIGPLLGPKMGRVLSKIGQFILPPLNIHPLCVLRGVALGFKPLWDYVPLMRSLCHGILQDTKNFVPHYSKSTDWQMSYEKCASMGVGLTVDNRYKLSPDSICELDLKLSLGLMGKEIQSVHPLFEVLLDRDTDGRHCIFVSHN